MRPLPTSSRRDRRAARRTPAARWGKVLVTCAAFAFAAAVPGFRIGPSDPAGASSGATPAGSPDGAVTVDVATGTATAAEAPLDGTAAPSTSTTAARPAVPREPLVIHGTGDVNLDPAAVPAVRGGSDAWAGVRPLFLGDDLTVVNLECAASNRGRAVPKEFNFRCDTAALPAMRAAGVEVANLGNNHSGDFGPEALLDAIDNLQAAGIRPVGAGRDATEAATATVVDVKGWRVAVLGFGGVVPSRDWIAGPDRAGMADGDDVEAMVAAVAAAAEQSDLVVVSIHWGAELDTQPRTDDVDRAHRMIDAGADIVFGHHAHRLQPLGWHADRPVAWGLGNFVWPRLSAAGATTAVARVEVDVDGAITACLVPAVIDAAGRPMPTGANAGGCGDA